MGRGSHISGGNFFFGKRGKKENEPQTEDEAEVKTEYPQKDSGGDQNAGVFIPEVSDQEAEVVYAGEEFTKSVFSAGGGMLYVYGAKDDGAFFSAA